MKLLEINIRPLSGFGTPLKGDTIFGHFCWQAAHDPGLLTGGLEKWLDCYGEKPFAVFSSAWPKLTEKGNFRYAVKRPDLPLTRLFRTMAGDKRTAMQKRKEYADKKWLMLDADLNIALDEANYCTEGDLLKMALRDADDDTKRFLRGKGGKAYVTECERPHNTINRRTMTTGEGMFAPFESTLHHFFPETELAVFVLFAEGATDAERICRAIARIGQFGFGRDASTGSGRFTLSAHRERDLPACKGANACYALAPVLPETGRFKDFYFTPFTRFGRHGDILASSSRPFKNPVIMADAGAVCIMEDHDNPGQPYLGRTATDVSLAQPQAVVQGYAPYLPFKLEN